MQRQAARGTSRNSHHYKILEKKHGYDANWYVKKVKEDKKGEFPMSCICIKLAQKVEEVVYAIGDKVRDGRPCKFSMTLLTSFLYKSLKD